MKPSLHGIVESAQRSEARREGDLRDGKTRLNNELPSKIESCVVVELLGGLSKFFFKQPSQMSRRHSKSIGKRIFCLMLQCSLCNELERPLDRGMLAVPRWRSGSRLGTAP